MRASMSASLPLIDLNWLSCKDDGDHKARARVHPEDTFKVLHDGGVLHIVEFISQAKLEGCSIGKDCSLGIVGLQRLRA